MVVINLFGLKENVLNVVVCSIAIRASLRMAEFVKTASQKKEMHTYTQFLGKYFQVLDFRRNTMARKKPLNSTVISKLSAQISSKLLRAAKRKDSINAKTK